MDEDEEIEMEEATLLEKRNFYLYMSPFDGHQIAEERGGFLKPSNDIMEAELRDVLKAWLTLQHSSGGEMVANFAWWMLKVFDPDGVRNANDSMHVLDLLTSFLISSISQLVQADILAFTEDVAIPDILLSSEFKFGSEDTRFLRQMESLWEDPDDEL